MHLMTLPISAGVSGQAKFEALPFSSSPFQIQVFLCLVPPKHPANDADFPQLSLENQRVSSSHTYLGERSACAWFQRALE